MTDSVERDVRRLFLVDDEPLVLRAIERTMRNQGYEIRSFSCAEDALVVLDADRPDCIVSDYYMPRTDGLAFLERVSKLHPRIGRVLLTGGHIDERVREALGEQIIHVLIQKPWHIDSMREVMEHIRAGRCGVFVQRRANENRGIGKRVDGGAEPEQAHVQAAGSTVLVVDDDKDFLRMMEIRLQRLGYQVLVSATAEHALETVREARPDVVLVDLILRDASGPQLIAGLKDLHPRMPVVAVTCSVDRDLAVEAFHRGAIGVLRKPLDMIALEATLRRCLQLAGLFLDGSSKPELSAIIQVQHAMASGTAESGLLDLLLQEMIRYTQADAASILLLEPDGKTMRIAASFGLDERVVEEARVAVGERISGWVVEHDEPRVVIGEATGEDWRLSSGERIRPASMGMCLPMRGRDGVIGALCTTRFDGDEIFSRDAIELGLLLGGEVARALERAEAVEKKLDMERSVMRRDKLVTIGELASGVAHEINNPLGFVNSNISSLEGYFNDILPVLSCLAPGNGGADSRAALDAAQKVDLGFILSDLPACMRETRDGLERVLKIVADLRDFVRDDTDVGETGNLNEILDGAANILWNQVRYKAELVKEYADLPEISCYPSQLGQVFLNLLHNAAQSIESGGRIVVRTLSENGSVVVEVEDNGCGMKPEVMEKIFEPFYTTKPRGMGTGLGLSIAKKIVEKHGGTMDVNSEEGRGSRFRIIFPLPEKLSAAAKG